MSDQHATRVVLSFAPGDDRTASSLRSDRFRGYLRRVHDGPVAVGDEWAEFVSRGCGTTRDVTLRVVAVEDGDAVGAGTAFAFEPR